MAGSKPRYLRIRDDREIGYALVATLLMLRQLANSCWHLDPTRGHQHGRSQIEDQHR